MKYNFVLNEENRPIVTAIEEHPQEDGVLLEVPDEFDVMSAEDWKYEDGVWVYDPLPEPEQPEPIPEETETADDVLNALLGVSE